MTSAQLIPVSPGTIGNIHCLTVDGRALHRVLKVRRDFSTWIKKRISDYGFEEGKDYEKYSINSCSPERGNNSPNDFKEAIDYKLEISMGKELCMVEKTEAGRVARRYFIECERRLRTASSQAPALDSTATPSTAEDRRPLRSLVYAWSQAAALPINSCWPQVKAHFQLSRIDDLPLEWIPDALAFVQGKIDGLPKALPESNVSLDPETAAYLAGKYPQAREAFMNSANPQADASAAQITRLCAELRFHANAMRENEREIYAAIKRAQTGPIFNPADPRRDAYCGMHKTMDRIFYVLENAIEAAESHANTMCVMNRV